MARESLLPTGSEGTLSCCVFLGLSESLVFGANYGTTLSHFVTPVSHPTLPVGSLYLSTCCSKGLLLKTEAGVPAVRSPGTQSSRTLPSR